MLSFVIFFVCVVFFVAGTESLFSYLNILVMQMFLCEVRNIVCFKKFIISFLRVFKLLSDWCCLPALIQYHFYKDKKDGKNSHIT